MRILTIHEPWATLTAQGRKPLENRPERVAKAAASLVGQWVAIHAGLRLYEDLPERAPDGRPWPAVLHHGHVVALARLDRIEPPGSGPWRQPGAWALWWGKVIRLGRPVPTRGGQGWRRFDVADRHAWAAVVRQAGHVVALSSANVAL